MAEVSMKREKKAAIFFIIILAIGGLGVSGDDFDVGLTYYLLNDLESARPYFNRFFVNTNNQRVADAYVELFKDKTWEAAERFKRYLEMNHRSLIAIIGMSLSTRHLRNSTSLETLDRALRLHPRSPSVQVAMGFEYFTRKDYPKAEGYFARGLTYGKEDVYKIPLGYLFIEMNEPREALNMAEKGALADKKNFHFNYLAAKAHYQLNNWSAVGPFIQNAIQAKPRHVESRLLWARFLVNQNRSAEARDVLKGMQVDGYQVEYEKIMAEILFNLQDRQAYGKMVEVLIQSPWDKDINRMMGLHHLRAAKGENIQHWINRALIAGNSEVEIKALFPAKYQIQAPFELPFFNVTALAWMDDQYLIIGGKRKSGDRDQVFILDSKTGRIASSQPVSGDILQIKTSGKNSDWAFINTVGTENQSTYVYMMVRKGNSFSCRPIQSGPYRMADIVAAFSRDDQRFYFVSRNLTEALYQAPFMAYDAQFQRRPLFPSLPIPVYSVNKKNGSVTQVKASGQLAELPIKALRDYALLAQAFKQDESIRSTITEGFSIDLAASRTVRAFCNDASDGAVVYTTDVEAKRGFDAILYSTRDRSSIRLNETAFMGKNRYAEVEVVRYDPGTQDLTVRTLGENKELIQHQIKGKMTRILGEKLIDSVYWAGNNSLYFLIEKKQKLFEKETQLFQVSLKPYSKDRVKKREDIIKIQKAANGQGLEFVTFNGEILTLDLENEFSYQRPALNTLLHAVSPGGSRGAFVNGRILVGI